MTQAVPGNIFIQGCVISRKFFWFIVVFGKKGKDIFNPLIIFLSINNHLRLNFKKKRLAFQCRSLYDFLFNVKSLR